jgi:hypothetical protein
MPTFRCDFEVKSDLVLPAGQAEWKAATPTGHEIVLRNDATDSSCNISGLVGTVVGNAAIIDGADSTFRAILARYFDVLTFATQSRFLITKVRRLMDWEPGPGERRMKIFETFNGSYPPERGLTCDYADTVMALETSGIESFVRVALKYFRYGVLEASPEDQFLRFWLALEVIAENQKPSGLVTIHCGHCKLPMNCASCGEQSQRLAMAKDAITEIIGRITGDFKKSVSRRLFVARNGIMHGRSVESIEKDCKLPMDRILDELGTVTWEAIASAIPLPEEGSKLAFGYREGFTSKKLMVAMIGGFHYRGDEAHPSEENLPNAQIQVIGSDQTDQADDP